MTARLVYTDTGEPVEVGDLVVLEDQEVVVRYFRHPHKASSSGKVSVDVVEAVAQQEFYVGVIGARWIDREDQ